MKSPTTTTAGTTATGDSATPAATVTKAARTSTAAVEPTDLVDPAKTSAKATADFSQGAVFIKKGESVPDDVLAGLSHGDLTRLEKVAGVITVSKRG